MSEKLFESQTKLLEKLVEGVSSGSVMKARSYRSDRHSEKSECSERSQECNMNNNNAKNVEESCCCCCCDDVERFSLMFKYYHELEETFTKIMNNDKVNVETKKEFSRKMYEITQKMELEKYATLKKRLSSEKDQLTEREVKMLIHEINKTKESFNTNMNSYSEVNKKSKKNIESLTSNSETVDDSDRGRNNNAEGYSYKTESTSAQSSETDPMFLGRIQSNQRKYSQRGDAKIYKYKMHYNPMPKGATNFDFLTKSCKGKGRSKNASRPVARAPVSSYDDSEYSESDFY